MRDSVENVYGTNLVNQAAGLIPRWVTAIVPPP
uniref:Uncharacterized protein n=1 Tax=Anguilla anguilla TaxID=7936 RepID=A0A0E9V6X3_ANGAN